jgi:hypothetical protein
LRLPHRQHFEQNRVSDAKHCGVGADPDGQRQDRRQHKPGRTAEGAEGVAQILCGVVQLAETARIAALLFRVGEAADRAQRCLLRGPPGHPGREILRYLLLEVELHLIIELVLDASAPQQGPDF